MYTAPLVQASKFANSRAEKSREFCCEFSPRVISSVNRVESRETPRDQSSKIRGTFLGRPRLLFFSGT
jgi:hypothetical protein